MRVLAAATLTLAIAGVADAANVAPTAVLHDLAPLSTVGRTVIPALDLAKVQREDERNFLLGHPVRVAVPHPVNITPQNAGTWEAVDANTSVWRLIVESPNALHLNLGFTRYHMPEGGQLFLYNPDYSDVMRPFTAADNMEHGQLWTAMVNGSKTIVELTIPNDVRDQLELVLGSINVGYHRFGRFGAKDGDEGGEDSLSCNIDVLCAQGAAWVDQIPAVGRMIIGGSSLCTGVLLNNTAQDRKPLLLTANHCGITAGNAASVVVYWNYHNSFCRTPGSAQSGQPGNGSQTTFSTGSIFRMGLGTSDTTLVELSQAPNLAWQLSYAGWDRTGVNSVGGAGIHHPNGEEKRISLYTNSTNNSSWPSCGVGGSNHVRVIWSQGLTEGGSSGSPLFDANKRVIGQLTGGPAPVCGGTNLDCYGRISAAWFGGGSASTRLMDWLDPLNTGTTTLNTLTGIIPSNDTCVNATLKGPGTHAFTTVNASTDGFDETGSCNFNGVSQIMNDVWFKTIAQCTGTMTVSLCGATYNTKMAAYQGCPAGPGAVLACNDDACGTASQISFPVVVNTIYQIRIGGVNGSMGTGSMTISCTPGNNCPADVTGDLQVNVNDLLAVINAWGPCASPCPPDCSPSGGDGVVNVNDLLAVINGWGPCP